MHKKQGEYGQLISIMYVNKKAIALSIFYRLFFCVLFWSVWIREDILTILIVILISLPVLLFPLIHINDKTQLYEYGLLHKKRFYSWEDIGTVNFHIYKANAWQWMTQVKMATNCKEFNVTFLQNPRDRYNEAIGNINITEMRDF